MPFDMPKTGSFEQRGGWVVRSLAKEFGLALFQAAAPVGNFGFESAGFTKLQEIRPAVSGSRGGWGWGQWTGPRRVNFEHWANAVHLPLASDEANYEFVVVELKGPYKYVIERLKRTTTLEQAVFQFGHDYEAPGGTTETHLSGFNDRLDWARRALAGAQAGVVDIAPSVPSIPAVTIIIPTARQMQASLIAAGLDVEIDGIWGPQSAAALMTYYNSNRG